VCADQWQDCPAHRLLVLLVLTHTLLAALQVMTPARLPGTSPVENVRPADAAGLLAALRVVTSGTMAKPHRL